MDDDAYTVGAVARLAGVSVRTLHHYHQVGLLSPSGRSAAGQDAHAHLRRQHRMLREQITRRQDMLAAIEKELEAATMGIALTPEEQLEIFGTTKVTGEWAEEAERRWGDTEAWAQSQRRAAAYTKQDWLDIKAEAFAINQGYAAAMTAGIPADDPRATDLAERHRQHISGWFYDCTSDMHRGLAEMYISDARFTANYDKVAPGLAQYVHDAILANAERGQGRAGRPG